MYLSPKRIRRGIEVVRVLGWIVAIATAYRRRPTPTTQPESATPAAAPASVLDRRRKQSRMRRRHDQRRQSKAERRTPETGSGTAREQRRLQQTAAAGAGEAAGSGRWGPVAIARLVDAALRRFHQRRRHFDCRRPEKLHRDSDRCGRGRRTSERSDRVQLVPFDGRRPGRSRGRRIHAKPGRQQPQMSVRLGNSRRAQILASLTLSDQTIKLK